MSGSEEVHSGFVRTSWRKFPRGVPIKNENRGSPSIYRIQFIMLIIHIIRGPKFAYIGRIQKKCIIYKPGGAAEDVLLLLKRVGLSMNDPKIVRISSVKDKEATGASQVSILVLRPSS